MHDGSHLTPTYEWPAIGDIQESPVQGLNMPHIFEYCCKRWPHKKELDPSVRRYWEAQGELTVGYGLFIHGHQIVVPKAIQAETPRKLHESHQGILRWCLRAKRLVWWPGLSRQLTEFIKKCSELSQNILGKRLLLTSSTSEEQITWW